MEAGREFQFLEVIGTNVLANEVVRHFSNLTAKECWESAKRVLWEELLTLTHRSTCRGSIYSKGKVQKYFFGEPASRESRLKCMPSNQTCAGSSSTRYSNSFRGRQWKTTLVKSFSWKITTARIFYK